LRFETASRALLGAVEPLAAHNTTQTVSSAQLPMTPHIISLPVDSSPAHQQHVMHVDGRLDFLAFGSFDNKKNKSKKVKKKFINTGGQFLLPCLKLAIIISSFNSPSLGQQGIFATLPCTHRIQHDAQVDSAAASTALDA
jgi:hypothetical protein